jgi:hypothetical protein
MGETVSIEEVYERKDRVNSCFDIGSQGGYIFTCIKQNMKFPGQQQASENPRAFRCIDELVVETGSFKCNNGTIVTDDYSLDLKDTEAKIIGGLLHVLQEELHMHLKAEEDKVYVIPNPLDKNGIIVRVHYTLTEDGERFHEVNIRVQEYDNIAKYAHSGSKPESGLDIQLRFEEIEIKGQIQDNAHPLLMNLVESYRKNFNLRNKEEKQ